MRGTAKEKVRSEINLDQTKKKKKEKIIEKKKEKKN